MTRRLLAAALIGALAACAWQGSTGTRANGVPQLVKLTYLDGVSNFGPKDAEGVLEFSFAEAYVRVDVKNLVPQAEMTYESWMVAPGGDSLYVGNLAVDAAGIGSYEGKLANLNSYDYNLFVVAARPANAPTGAMPDKKAIAGRFVVIGNNGTTKIGDIRPGLLPDTGEPSARGVSGIEVATMIAAAIASAGAFAAIRLTRHGGTHD